MGATGAHRPAIEIVAVGAVAEAIVVIFWYFATPLNYPEVWWKGRRPYGTNTDEEQTITMGRASRIPVISRVHTETMEHANFLTARTLANSHKYAQQQGQIHQC